MIPVIRTFEGRMFLLEAEKKGIKFNRAEILLVEGVESTNETDVRKANAATDLYTMKRYEIMVNNLIESNERSSAASEKQANQLKWATWALVGATVGLLIATIAMPFIQQ